MNYSEILHISKKELKSVSSQAWQESLWILSEVLNLPPEKIFLKSKNIEKRQQEIFFEKIQKRKKGEPLEYILKEKFFFTKSFYVEKGAFIPRKETETIIHWLLENFQSQTIRAVDFGAGVGSICLTALSLIPKSRFVAVEINNKSIKCLKKNKDHFQLNSNRLKIVKKDICQLEKKDFHSFLGQAPSLIVANPPYIDSKDPSIHPDVYLFDSPLALFSDKKGLGHIYSWFEKAMDFLDSKAVYIFEFGWNQLEEVRDFCKRQKQLSSFEIHKDQQGIPRIAVCFKK